MGTERKKEYLRSVASFTPYNFVYSKINERKEVDYFESVLLFADISGFTAMSEKLTSLGKEGSEEVNRIINRFFDPLINVIYRWGGHIYCFGGDAFLAFFPTLGDSRDASERGMNAAIEIMRYVKGNCETETKIGKFKIKVHIGLTKGGVYFQDLGSNFFIGGRVVNELMEMMDRSEAGEIIVSSEVKSEVRGYIFERKGGSFKYLGIRRREKGSSKGYDIRLTEDYIDLSDYIPEWLSKRIEVRPTFDYKDGEHRKISVVFLHFSGIDYDGARDRARLLIDKFYRIVRESVDKFDGWICKIDNYKDSDRVLVVFGFPVTYEDDEKRAVLFTYEILNHPELRGIDLRAGINSGYVFASPIGNDIRREYAILGDSVNISARFGANGERNSIVVGEGIFNKTYSEFSYEYLGEREYKGKREKIKVYKLVNKKEYNQTSLTKWISESDKIIGRDVEIEIFKRSIRGCFGGKGRIISIVGEPGIGKSRLVQELILLSEREGFNILKGNCISYGSAFSYHPWIEVLNQFFNIRSDDLKDIKYEKIKDKIKEVNENLLDWLPLIGDILGVNFPETSVTRNIDLKIKKEKIFEIVFDIIKFLSKMKPVTLIIEDFHWADSMSLDLVNYISKKVENLPVILTLVYRPLKEKEDFLSFDWVEKISLKELPDESIVELIKNLLGTVKIPKNIENIIIKKSQGNPFYIEELVKSLIEQGYIFENNGVWEVNEDFETVEIPDSVESIILSRVDRLAIQDRDVLQFASVLGREFDEILLKKLYPDKEILEKSLPNLERFDLLKKETKERECKYMFKHILTQEVAYGTLSFGRKKELHRKVGFILEKEFKNRKNEFLGLLAHHYYAGEDYDKALIYSVEAAEKSERVYANEEALEFLEIAIDSYEKLEGKI